MLPLQEPHPLAKMPFGLSAGSTRSEDGSEAFLEGMGNSCILYFIHSFPRFSHVSDPVQQLDPGAREGFQERSLVAKYTSSRMEVELGGGVGWPGRLPAGEV